MRFLSILFNPVGHLLWWIARTVGGGIDRRLGPLTGWLLAWVIVLSFAVSLAGAAYGVRDQMAKLSGWQQREEVRQVEGSVTSAETLTRKTMTVTQDIVAEYDAGEGTRQIRGSVTEPSIAEKKPGDTITVYVQGQGDASLRNPEDPLLDAVLAVVAVGFPLAGLFFALRYLRHRSRLRQAALPADRSREHLPGQTPRFPVTDEIVIRGRQKIKSRDQRLREEAELIRRMHENAKKRDQS